MDGIPDSINEVRRISDVLGAVARSFPSDSVEAFAVREATLAYLTVQRDSQLKASYRKLRLSMGSRLTDEMKARLKELGFVPDETDDDEPPVDP